jgi:hypothetical protein
MTRKLSVLPCLLSLILAAPLAGAAIAEATLDLDAAARQALGLTGGHVSPVAVSLDADRLIAALDLDGAPAILELRTHSVRATGFEVIEIGADGVPVSHDPGQVTTLRGALAGRGGMVAATLTDEGVFARIAVDDQEWFVQPIAELVPGASPQDHVVYGADDVPDVNRTCGADLIAQPFALFEPTPGSSSGTYGMSTVSVTELACDADFQYFQDYGTVNAVQNRIETVINTVNMQYEAEVAITHEITTIIVRTSSSQPYTSTDAVTLLNQFRSEWNSNQSGVQRDVAELFTGKEINGGTIGIAWVGVVCNLSYAYNMVQSDFNGAFLCATDLSAHELGHNWGANHCNCTSNTMNPYITCANTFHPSLTIPEITSYRDSVGCLESSGGGGGDPTSVHVSAITPFAVKASKGKKHAAATVTIVDDQGGAVAGASVTVQFSGDINETRSGTTNASGSVTLQTVGTKKGKLNFTACVTNVSASLPYAPGDNVETCD